MRFREIINEDGDIPVKRSLTGNFDHVISAIKNAQFYLNLSKNTEKESDIKYYENVIKYEKNKLDAMPSLKNNIALIIKQRCNKYLTIFKQEDTWLWRGLQNSKLGAFESESVNNRCPKDSNAKMSRLFDKCASQIGIQALRSNSIFTTSKKIIAKAYGDAYVIIPEDTADFSWSITKTDLVLNNDSFGHLYELSESLLQSINEELLKYRKIFLNDLSNNTDLFKINALQRYVSILSKVVSSKSLITNFNTLNFIKNNFPDSILISVDIQELPISLEKFNKEFKLNGTDMASALKSEHEVLIHGKYIAVAEALWPEVKKLL